MKRIYQRQELLEERVEAFNRLGERVEILSRGATGKVVTLTRKAAWTPSTGLTMC